jgi:hypothetical protein
MRAIVVERLLRPAAVWAAVLLSSLWLGTGGADAEDSCVSGWPPFPGSLKVEVVPGQATVGEPVELRWRIDRKQPRGPAAFEVPAYLVVTAPEATRVDGKGFFALASGARGPYGMTFGAGRTRLITPLNTRFSADSGTMAVLPYQAGALDLEWAIVQADQCGERVSGERGQTMLEITPGTPELVAHDEFATATPRQILKPLAGPFLARVYEGAIEVENRLTGDIVLQTTGRSATFSPTGRFIVVETDEAEISDVFDLLAGIRLGRFQSVGMYWSHADSFLYLDQEWDGTMQIVRTLHGRRQPSEAAPSLDPLTKARFEDSTLPANAVHAGIDQQSQDIDAGSGAGSFTAGSEVWAMNLTIEGGVVAFLNQYLVDDERPDERDGHIIDLGLSNPMITVTRRSEIEGLLASDFGVAAAPPEGWQGWNVNDTLTYTWNYYESATFLALGGSGSDEGEAADGADGNDQAADGADNGSEAADDEAADDDIPTVPTQTVVEAASLAVEAASGTSKVRSAVPLATASLVSSLEPSILPLQPGFSPKALRSGIDNAKLEEISKALGELYDPAVATFGASPGSTWQGEYATLPFPSPASKADEPIDLGIAGRDTWAWETRKGRYWLTQTIESGRLGHAFSFTLVGYDGRRLRQADLLSDPSIDAESPGEGAEVMGLIQRGDLRGSLDTAFGEPSAVAVVSDRFLLLATRPIVRLIAFDLDAWKPACIVARPYNQAGIDRLTLSQDGRALVQINRNGAVEIYSCADGTRALSGIIADGDLVVMDAGGHFDGSEDAAAYVELKLPGLPGRQLLSQFAKELRAPGLAEAVLEGRWSNAAPVKLNPPTVSVSMSTGGQAFEIEARSGIGLKSLQVLSGGRLAQQWDLDGPSAKFAEQTGGLAGIVTFIAIDVNGVSSAPFEMLLGGAGATARGRMLGFAVGIDSYPAMPGSDLRFSAADARRIAAVVGASSAYESVDVEPLVNEQASADAIRARLDKLIAKAGPDDTILLSFAGHGLVDRDGRLRLALSTTEAGRIEETSLDFEEIAARLRSARARVLILLDVCHAGAAGRTEVASNDDAVRQLSTDTGAGIVILSASKGRQFSEEAADIGGGRFSVAFGRVVGGDRASFDADGNGRISLRELYGGVKSIVARQTGGRQVPWLARNQIFGDFDIF